MLTFMVSWFTTRVNDVERKSGGVFLDVDRPTRAFLCTKQ